MRLNTVKELKVQTRRGYLNLGSSTDSIGQA